MIKNLAFSAFAAGLLALTPATLQAQPTTVNITLEAIYQNPSVKQSTNGNMTTTGTLSTRITPATLQTVISSNLGISLNGYVLVWDQAQQTLGETNAKTGDFQSVASIMSIGTDASGSGDFVTWGLSDSVDQIAQSQTTASIWTITFDDGNGNAATLTGLVKLTASLAAPAKGAIGATQTETIFYSGSVTGYGTIVDKQGNTDNAVFLGSVSGEGRGAAGS